MCTSTLTAIADCSVDNEQVRVTRWSFAPGAETGHHRHEYDYVITPITHSQMRIEDAQGERIVELLPGVSYFRPAGIEHNVTNVGDDEMIFVELELKPSQQS
ncbi:Protein export cytoplasm protein SecA ATPase RNA helicase [Marinobacterium lacunae]|uniref:Protein export cytoplasm protein SecA ATPase RNA helicase n=1 Tax=Marinobacterium lacunae TaxID=1232683 RepID=A0A081G2R3_9GAMM|nr:cupin domain-containing protein [Marinobacterium lacunae]KEA65068.1 Protein export cytoplasm protein SecA ATPase RNA helicase [Marinobacterium lacunae]